jgi:hypothetical protein
MLLRAVEIIALLLLLLLPLLSHTNRPQCNANFSTGNVLKNRSGKENQHSAHGSSTPKRNSSNGRFTTTLYNKSRRRRTATLKTA